GHADFGGEVERALRMVDGVVLLCDAAEGPLPQTRFVLGKAMGLGLPVIVVINKIDRADARPHEVLDEVLSLLIDLGADDDQLDCPVIYAIGKEGKATTDLSVPGTDLRPLFDAILAHIPPPREEEGERFRMLVNNLDYDDFVGRLVIGRIHTGRVRTGQTVAVLREDGQVGSARVTALYGF